MLCISNNSRNDDENLCGSRSIVVSGWVNTTISAICINIESNSSSIPYFIGRLGAILGKIKTVPLISGHGLHHAAHMCFIINNENLRFLIINFPVENPGERLRN